MLLRRAWLAAITVSAFGTSCIMDRAPRGLKRTPDGPGATVRYDLGHTPLPDIPLPTDTATSTVVFVTVATLASVSMGCRTTSHRSETLRTDPERIHREAPGAATDS